MNVEIGAEAALIPEKEYINGGIAVAVWLIICAFPHILGSSSSNMTLQLLHSEFPYINGKLDFFSVLGTIGHRKI